ncbi:MAG: dTDP-glucose pyrophosphorylase [Frankiales bacterium]|nr:dTDP-glucose pyrophosphorylase [Frankiales bacterium]
MSGRIVAVIPAAGHGTGLTGTWEGSKEVLPVRGRPVIDHLVDRLHLADPQEIRIVTRPDKQDLRDHLASLAGLGIGLDVVLGEPADVAASLLLGIAGLDDDDVVLSGFPDTVWEPTNGFLRLAGALRADPLRQVALGLFQLADVRTVDEVVVEADEMGLTVVSVRPRPTDPASDITWGCFAARVSALRGLADVSEPGELWDRLARDEPGAVVGLHFGRAFVDVGTPEGRDRAGT